jgi:hypothetical protein
MRAARIEEDPQRVERKRLWLFKDMVVFEGDGECLFNYVVCNRGKNLLEVRCWYSTIDLRWSWRPFVVFWVTGQGRVGGSGTDKLQIIVHFLPGQGLGVGCYRIIRT